MFETTSQTSTNVSIGYPYNFRLHLVEAKIPSTKFGPKSLPAQAPLLHLNVLSRFFEKKIGENFEKALWIAQKKKAQKTRCDFLAFLVENVPKNATVNILITSMICFKCSLNVRTENGSVKLKDCGFFLVFEFNSNLMLWNSGVRLETAVCLAWGKLFS